MVFDTWCLASLPRWIWIIQFFDTSHFSSYLGVGYCLEADRPRLQAIGRSRGGRTTKIHALTDDLGRPLRLMLTGGQVADCTAAAALLEGLPANLMVHGDKGYDSNAVRHQIEIQGCVPNIPPKSNRKWKNCFSPYLYRGRNAIERMFSRLKDFRHIHWPAGKRSAAERRHQIRPPGLQLSGCHPNRGDHLLLVMSLDPNAPSRARG